MANCELLVLAVVSLLSLSLLLDCYEFWVTFFETQYASKVYLPIHKYSFKVAKVKPWGPHGQSATNNSKSIKTKMRHEGGKWETQRVLGNWTQTFDHNCFREIRSSLCLTYSFFIFFFLEKKLMPSLIELSFFNFFYGDKG